MIYESRYEIKNIQKLAMAYFEFYKSIFLFKRYKTGLISINTCKSIYADQ